MNAFKTLALAALAGFALTPMTAHAQARAQVQEVAAPAPALEGNLLGTATEQSVAIYLPPSYARARARRYPVVYLLHGIFDGGQVWLNHVEAPAILDRLIAAQRIPEVIVVMPDGLNQYGGGFYRNSPVSGRWGDFIADDLIRYVDTNYRTIARPGGRAIVGWSMGGYGAIHLAMERPGLYAAAYGISPCCLSLTEDLGHANDAWIRTLGLETPADIETAARNRDFYPLALMGVVSAFSTSVEPGPFHVALPYQVVRGQVIPKPAALERLSNEFPLARAASGRAALTQLRAFGFDYGVNEQFAHIPAGARDFSSRLSELNVPHRLDVYEGDHRDRVPERLETTVLPYIVNALDPPEN